MGDGLDSFHKNNNLISGFLTPYERNFVEFNSIHRLYLEKLFSLSDDEFSDFLIQLSAADDIPNPSSFFNFLIHKLDPQKELTKIGFLYHHLIDRFYNNCDKQVIEDGYGSIESFLKNVAPEMGDRVFWEAQKHLLDLYSGREETIGPKDETIFEYTGNSKDFHKFKQRLLLVTEGDPVGFSENIDLLELKKTIEKSFPNQKEIIQKLDEIIEYSKKALNSVLVNELKNFAAE